MAEQELDLLQFPAPAAAQLGAGPPQIMRPQAEAQLVAVENRGGEDRLRRRASRR